MSPEERSGIENGIWLCQTCARLVDLDAVTFSSEKLHEIKTRHESEVASGLGRPPPSISTADGTSLSLWYPVEDSIHWLIFAALQAPSFVGRRDEVTALTGFLEDERQFLWWLVLGEAGMGKSRLAREVCELYKEAGWEVGFLRSETFKDWENWQPSRDVLIVVDYAASRPGYVSDAVFSLYQRTNLAARVRFLLLERDNGADWWSKMMRAHSQVETSLLESVLYESEPLVLNPLSDDDIVELAISTAKATGTSIGETDLRRFPLIARELDPRARPLFVMVAALEERTARSGDMIEALRRLIRKEESRWLATIDTGNRDAFLRLVLLGTLVGGDQELRSRGSKSPLTELAQQLLSDLVRGSADLRTAVGRVPNNSLSFRLEPDLLGELYVLDQLQADLTAQTRVEEIIGLAWKHEPASLGHFARRAYSDLSTHSGLRFLDLMDPGNDPQLYVWSQLVTAMVNATGHKDLKRHQVNIRRLADFCAARQEPDLRAALFRAENAFAWALHRSGNRSEAIERFRAMSSEASGFESNERATALNNLGCVHMEASDERTAAFECFSGVINIDGASSEVYACSLNNRADIFHDRGDYPEAVRDRSSLLELTYTSFDRRYIALSRRASSKLRMADAAGALVDLQAVVDTPDIHQEQKAEAYLFRAKILSHEDKHERSIEECELVELSSLLFPGTLAEARVLKARGLAHVDRGSEALELVKRAVSMVDISDSVHATAIQLIRSLEKTTDGT